jgi:hypothetical protein
MNQTSRLLRLPSELRNRIYELVLIQPDAIRLPQGRSESGKRDLLCTCRQIHDEAVGIYYGSNAFIADCGSWFLNVDLICWLRGLGPKKRSMLRDVRLSLRQQRVLGSLSGPRDMDFFITALMKKLDAMGLMLPKSAIRVEAGSVHGQVSIFLCPFSISACVDIAV